jgi:hypothetical protein
MLDAGKAGLTRLYSFATAANPMEIEMSVHAPQSWSDEISLSAESAEYSWEEQLEISEQHILFLASIAM